MTNEFSSIVLREEALLSNKHLHHFIVDYFINLNMDEEVYFPMSTDLIEKLLLDINQRNFYNDIEYTYLKECLTNMLNSKDKFIYYTNALKHE